MMPRVRMPCWRGLPAPPLPGEREERKEGERGEPGDASGVRRAEEETGPAAWGESVSMDSGPSRSLLLVETPGGDVSEPMRPVLDPTALPSDEGDI